MSLGISSAALESAPSIASVNISAISQIPFFLTSVSPDSGGTQVSIGANSASTNPAFAAATAKLPTSMRMQDGGAIQVYRSQSQLFLVDGNPTLVFVLQAVTIDPTAVDAFYFGVADSTSLANNHTGMFDTHNRAGFLYQPSINGNWQGFINLAAGPTHHVVDTGVPVDTNTHVMKVVFKFGVNITFFIDGVLVATLPYSHVSGIDYFAYAAAMTGDSGITAMEIDLAQIYMQAYI